MFAAWTSPSASPPEAQGAVWTDGRRLRQILHHLSANAVKFTARGHVHVRAELVTQGWSTDHPVLSKAEKVVSFSVEDTGIGIAPDKQRLIFEAFQQADAGTSPVARSVSTVMWADCRKREWVGARGECVDEICMPAGCSSPLAASPKLRRALSIHEESATDVENAD